MATLWQDFLYGARALRKSPVYLVGAVFTLAVGVGIVGAAFCVADAVLFRPLRFPQSDRLVLLHEATPSVPDMSVSYPNFLDWKAQSRSLVSLGGFRPVSMNLAGERGAQRVSALMVSADLFTALQGKALYGRVLTPGDDRPGAAPVAVLDHRFWRSRFAGDPAAVGRTLTLEGRSFVVVGVMPATFRIPSFEHDLWVPLGQWAEGELQDRGNHADMLVLGRLAQGATLDRARAELSGIATRLEAQYPSTNRRHAIVLDGWQESLIAPVRRTLLIVFTVALLVLLMAWFNICNLMVARVLARRPELATRAAFGASRGRLMRQLLIEALIVATLGLTIGLPLAAVGVRLLGSVATTQLPRFDEVVVDLRTIGAVALITVASGLALTSVPLLRALRGDLVREFAGSGRVAEAEGLGSGDC